MKLKSQVLGIIQIAKKPSNKGPRDKFLLANGP